MTHPEIVYSAEAQAAMDAMGGTKSGRHCSQCGAFVRSCADGSRRSTCPKCGLREPKAAEIGHRTKAGPVKRGDRSGCNRRHPLEKQFRSGPEEWADEEANE